jgi:transcriptional regulator of aroF, aroG, tyrA and aromatic amino acid transport
MNHEAPQVGIFESANGGTVFLDEIGEMSAHLQIKLLRFLQDGTFRKVGEEQEVHVDVRVIASTKANLAKLTEQGKFREDLYFRLNVLPLNIPPLRERNTDIAPLLDLYVAKYAHQLGITKPNFDAELIHQLSQYSWPGNIRELQNLTLQAMTRLDSDTLSLTHFHFSQAEQSSIPTKAMNLDGSLDEIMKQYESQIIQSLYHSFPSSRKLAKRLKVSHTSIANKLRDYGINKE